MQQKKGWIVWAFLFAVVFGSGIAIVVFFPREKLLLAQARRLSSNALWNQENSTNLFWLTENTALFYRYEEDAGTAESEMNLRFYRYDLAAQSSTPLNSFSTLFVKTGGNTFDMHISPDGQWVLWSGSGGGVTACRLDGTQSLHYKEPGLDGAVLCWLGDSLHWAAMLTDVKDTDKFDRAILHDLNSTRAIKTLAFSPDVPQEGGCFGSLDTGATPNHILGDTACWTGVVSTDEIVELGLGTAVTATQRHTVRLPQGAEIENILYSPRGDRVAWLLQTEYTLPFQALIHRVYPRYQATAHSVASIWVCRLDGTQMHEVGHIRLASDDLGTLTSTLPNAVVQGKKGPTSGWINSTGELNLRWMPDDKHLSFNYQDGLWTVSAD